MFLNPDKLRVCIAVVEDNIWMNVQSAIQSKKILNNCYEFMVLKKKNGMNEFLRPASQKNL